MSDLTGTTLGGYRILQQIGRGGMATVYKAYQPTMDRLVAVKVLHDQHAGDPHVVERFEHEARVIAGLEHPHIVPVYDFGRQGDLLFLVMRYMRAGTISDLLRRGPLSLPDSASLLADVAAGLDHAHSLKIVHRDIKPNNILVDSEGRAYLMDFGLAKVLDQSMELTLSGAAIGTPTYMAPEQVAGQKVSPHTDVYALGVMLYEMLTGRPPFVSDTPMAVAMMHLREAARSPKEYNPELPEQVEAIIKRALSKNPLDRYWSAGELAYELTEAAGAGMQATPSRAGLAFPGVYETTSASEMDVVRDATINMTPHLARLAREIANSKGPEEVTPEVRHELEHRERQTRRKRVLARAPLMGAVALVVVLASALAVTFRGLAASRSAAEGTATAVGLLVLQLGEAQTALALGDPSSMATVAYLQTQLADAAGAGAQGAPAGQAGSPSPSPTASATRSPATPTERSNAPRADFAAILPSPTMPPDPVTTRAAPTAVSTPPPAAVNPPALNAADPASPPADRPAPGQEKEKEQEKDQRKEEKEIEKEIKKEDKDAVKVKDK